MIWRCSTWTARQWICPSRASAAAPKAASTGRSVAADIDGYLYADRGIYRPGETVHLTAMVRDRMAEAVSDRKGEIVVKRPSGVEFKRYPFSQATAGAALADIALPRSAPRGRWTAELHIEGIEEATGGLSFSVEDFAPQRLAVTATGQEAVPLGAGDTRKVNVSARFLYGAPGAGLHDAGRGSPARRQRPVPGLQGLRMGRPVQDLRREIYRPGLDRHRRRGPGDPARSGPPTPATRPSRWWPRSPPRCSSRAAVRSARAWTSRCVRSRSITGSRSTRARPARAIRPSVSTSSPSTPPASRIGATATYTLVAERWDYDWFQQERPLAVAAQQPRRHRCQGPSQYRRGFTGQVHPSPGLGRLSP
ncbi:MG2 domain-containing protein [Caulobacter segnis]